MKFLPLLLILAGCAHQAAQAQTRVDLKQTPLVGNFRGVTCLATYWDDAGITPKGTCRFTSPSSGSGRGGGYVKPAQTWYAAVWDLFGNINVGLECAHRNQWTANPPAVVYYNGYYEAICNSTLIDQGEPFQYLPGVTSFYWIGPSIAGEYIAQGQIVYLP